MSPVLVAESCEACESEVVGGLVEEPGPLLAPLIDCRGAEELLIRSARSNLLRPYLNSNLSVATSDDGEATFEVTKD